MRALATAALALLILSGAAAARAQPTGSPAGTCRQAGDDDRLQPIPASLVSAAKRLFGIQHAPDAAVRRTTVFRCMGGAVMLCTTGANRPCDQADASRDPPGATRWCNEHPGTPMIPMVATGHATIFRWRCDGTEARAGEPVEQTDCRGFIARVWKRLG